jgi:hypothetical protein
VNGKTARETFDVTVKVPASAEITLNHYRDASTNHQDDEMKPVYIKGKDFDIAASNLKATVTAEGLKVTLTPANGGITAADIKGFNKNLAGPQKLRLELDEQSVEFDVAVVDAAPAVWFDYGYVRHAGDAAGKGPGVGKYYTQQNETLVLSPVRFLIGYNDDNTDAGVTYNWSVSGGSYSGVPSANGETYAFTPKATGSYTVTVSVSGRDYITGSNVTKSASTEVVCYSGTVSGGTAPETVSKA